MFKDKLKELREINNLSQKELANKIFVSRSAIAKWENGLGIPSDVNLESLCNLFNIKEEELLTRDDLKENIIKQKENRKHNLLGIVSIIINVFMLFLTIAILEYRFINHRFDQFMNILDLFNYFELIILFSSIFVSIAFQIILLLKDNGLIIINKTRTQIITFKRTCFTISIISLLIFIILAFLRFATDLRYHNYLVGFIEDFVWTGLIMLAILFHYLANKKIKIVELIFSILNYLVFLITISIYFFIFYRILTSQSSWADIFINIFANFLSFISINFSIIAIIFGIKDKRKNKTLFIINLTTISILIIVPIIAYLTIY